MHTYRGHAGVRKLLVAKYPTRRYSRATIYTKTVPGVLVGFLKNMNPLPLLHSYFKSERKIPNRQTFKNLSPSGKYFGGLGILIALGLIFLVAVQLYLINTQTVPARGGEYREGLIGAPRFINPALAPTNDVDRDISRLVYASLLKYDVNGELIPDLAESFEILSGGRQYRFNLKENIITLINSVFFFI